MLSGHQRLEFLPMAVHSKMLTAIRKPRLRDDVIHVSWFYIDRMLVLPDQSFRLYEGGNFSRTFADRSARVRNHAGMRLSDGPRQSTHAERNCSARTLGHEREGEVQL